MYYIFIIWANNYNLYFILLNPYIQEKFYSKLYSVVKILYGKHSTFRNIQVDDFVVHSSTI